MIPVVLTFFLYTTDSYEVLVFYSWGSSSKLGTYHVTIVQYTVGHFDAAHA
jgi:hypothetical protein